MRHYRSVFPFLLAALAAGCQTTGEVQGPAGAVRELIVNKSITFPMGGGGARFQYGARTTALNPADPYCILRRGGARAVEPDTFIITRVDYGSTSQVEDELPQHSGFYDETHLWLSSPKQPGVQHLVCRKSSSLSGGNLTSADIQAILGYGFILR